MNIVIVSWTKMDDRHAVAVIRPPLKVGTQIKLSQPTGQEETWEVMRVTSPLISLLEGDAVHSLERLEPPHDVAVVAVTVADPTTTPTLSHAMPA